MKKIFKKVPIIVWSLIILISITSIVFYFKPFLICPSWLHRYLHFSQYWNSFYCRNNNYESLIVKNRNSDWHLVMDCNNWKCIEYDENGNFNFIIWVKNFLKWIRSWYQPWDIEKIWNWKFWEYYTMIPNWSYYEYKNWILIMSWIQINWYTPIWEWYYYNEDWSLKKIANYLNNNDTKFSNWIYNWTVSYYYTNGKPSVVWEYLSWYATWLWTRYDKDWNITNTYNYNERTIECPEWYKETKLQNDWFIYAQFCENKEWIRSWEYIRFLPLIWTINIHWKFSNDMKEWLWIMYNHNWVVSSKEHYSNDIHDWKYETYYDNWEIISSLYMISWNVNYINHPYIYYYENWNIQYTYNNNEYIEYYENWNIKIKWNYNNLKEKFWTRYYYDENWKLSKKENYSHWFLIE